MVQGPGQPLRREEGHRGVREGRFSVFMTSPRKGTQVRVTAEKTAPYHKGTPPPPNLFSVCLGRTPQVRLNALVFRVAAMRRALIATHPYVALAQWRLESAARRCRAAGRAA